MENNIYLIGMPGSGKSTLGEGIARDLGKWFIDFDNLLEKTSKMTVGALLKELWDNMFSGYEKNLALWMDYSNTVISLSGSVSLIDEVMELLKTSWPVIYINTSLEIIKKRIPLMKTDRIIWYGQVGLEEIFEKRKTKYEKWADFTYVNNKDESKEQALESFKNYLVSLPESSGLNISFTQWKTIQNEFTIYSKYKVVWDFMYLSGQLWMDYETQDMVLSSIDEEFKQAFRNAKMILLWVGFWLKDVVKATIYLKDLKNYEIMNNIYCDYFVIKPARSVIEVSGLPRQWNILVELIAYKDPNGRVSTKRDWSPWKGI